MTPNAFNRAVLHLCALLLCLGETARAQIPNTINYQGRITVGATNFDGNGQFKFAFVDASGTTLWSNAPMAGGEPNAHVVLPVAGGIYSVRLGDTAVTNMATIPTSVFANADVRLRIWFNNGTIGFQQLSPDQRISAVGYAIMAASVPDGAITSSKLAVGAVTPEKLAPTSALTITNMGEVFTKSVITGEAPKQLTGTLTIDRNPEQDTANDVLLVECPALELSGSPTAKLSVTRLTARRPLTANTFWANWFQDTVAGQSPYGTVTLQFSNGPSVEMSDTFPTGYSVERGANGTFYETLTLKPGTYSMP